MPRPTPSPRKVLLVLPIGLDEAYLLHRYVVDVLNRKTAPPLPAEGRRVALYAGTRMGGRDFFGAANRAARERHLRSVALKVGTVHRALAGTGIDGCDIAPYAQRVVATAVLEGSSATSASPWWDGHGMAWKLRDVQLVKPMLPLEAGSASSGFRTVEEESDVVGWLLAFGAIRPGDVGPYISTRRRS